MPQHLPSVLGAGEVGPLELGGAKAKPPHFPSTRAEQHPGQTIQHLLVISTNDSSLISQAAAWAVPPLEPLSRGLEQDFLLKAFLSHWGLCVGQSPLLLPKPHTSG